MIETADQRAKRIKQEAAGREKRAAEYAEKMKTQLQSSNATPAAIIPTGAPIADPNAPLTVLGAKKITKQIRDHLDGAAALIIEAHKREAWKALGYPSWIAYALKEFEVSRAHAYRLLNHAETVDQIGVSNGDSPEKESQTRPMKKLNAPQKRKAWKKAVKLAAGGQPTAAQVAQAVTETLPPAANSAESLATTAPQETEIGESRADKKCPHCGGILE